MKPWTYETLSIKAFYNFPYFFILKSIFLEHCFGDIHEPFEIFEKGWDWRCKLRPNFSKKSLIPLAILFWSNVSMPSVPFCSNNFIYRAPSFLHILFRAIKLSQVRKLFRLSSKNLKHRFVCLICFFYVLYFR